MLRADARPALAAHCRSASHPPQRPNDPAAAKSERIGAAEAYAATERRRSDVAERCVDAIDWLGAMPLKRIDRKRPATCEAHRLARSSAANGSQIASAYRRHWLDQHGSGRRLSSTAGAG